ncbi:hypothetical protein JMJ55_15315 [Belnapia sp. T6]|uniref:Uncharacterized protein n=1 Tax=Belnapia mucosa TaxID=2804532 RepID=A0ABS1V4S8_9PROT|nr:hypothetical protein [Belnapia mucosa]MBL6456704.1 hypothetical protein [Belnapia mucosa]
MSVDTILSPDAEDLATSLQDEPERAEIEASDVRGLIDNATADRLYGWAWDAAHPGYRVKVELRLAGEVVATTVADNARPDLAKHGIGDGCHAFEFPLKREWFRKLRELSAVAYGKDGSDFLVPVHARRGEDMLVPAETTAQLQTVAESLLAEYSAVRRELQDLRERHAALPTPEAAEAAAQETRERLEAMELWLARLDDRVANMALPGTARSTRTIDSWQVVLTAILTSALCSISVLLVFRFGI